MYTIWATLTLLVGLVIIGTILWVFLLILSKAIFEDLLGAIVQKFRRKIKSKRDKDQYVY